MTNFRFNDRFQNKGKLKLKRAIIVKRQEKFVCWHYFLVTEQIKIQNFIGIVMYLLLLPIVLSFKKSKKDSTIIAIFYQKWVVFEGHTVIKTFCGLSADKLQLFFLF